MMGIRSKFVSLYFYLPIYSTDSFSSLVVSDGIVCATTSLTVNDVLFVPKFSISLLSISPITKNNNCSVALSYLLC